jgi:hypothetical protein
VKHNPKLPLDLGDARFGIERRFRGREDEDAATNRLAVGTARGSVPTELDVAR